MRVEVWAEGRAVAEVLTAATVVAGRQSTELGEPGPYGLVPASGPTPAKLVVAPAAADAISRRAVKFEPRGDGRVRVTNPTRTALAVSGRAVAPGASADFDLPVVVRLSDCELRVSREADSPREHAGEWGRLEAATLAPGSVPAAASLLPSLPALATDQLDDLVRWMQATAAVFQATVGSADFVAAAAAALVEIVGLDSGRVLFRDGTGWAEAACHPAGGDPLPPSPTVLGRVAAERRTFWKHEGGGEGTEIFRQLSMAVAAPVLDAGGEVVGVLYGDRRVFGGGAARGVGRPEALLVEMLACGVAAGVARRHHERQAQEAEARFAQFFTRDLAERLARDPRMLEGREADVSLLFADVRGFSRVSERAGPAGTVRWIGAILDALSECVLAEGGVLVDYVGDELFAMWGAPADQPDHAARAVRAGLAMLDAVPRLSEAWADRVGEPLHVGVGVNSGTALVGNIGSRVKFKYGPLGHAVNLASRVQGLTKYLKRPLLVTAATRGGLGPEFTARRVCRARVVNVAAPVDLYEVEAAGDAGRAAFLAESEGALDALEAGRFAEAARRAGALLGQEGGDGPLQLVLSRAAASLIGGAEPFDPVWAPPGK